jgi:hypothetical protein
MSLRASVGSDRSQFFEIKRIRSHLRSPSNEDDALSTPITSRRGDLDLPGVRSETLVGDAEREPVADANPQFERRGGWRRRSTATP